MNKNFILMILGGILGFVGLIYVATLIIPNEEATPDVEKIVIWGVFHDEEDFASAIDEYKKAHKNVKEIVYKNFACNKSECTDYLSEVTQGMAAAQGPDIFMINNTWVPKEKKKLISLDSVNTVLEQNGQEKIMTLRDYGDTFFPVAKKDLVFKDTGGVERIYAFPIQMDNLAVFYNRDLFSLAGMSPPPRNWTWQEFEDKVSSFDDYAKRATLIDDLGNIKKSGTAMGRGDNINRSSDILAVLMMQMGSPIVDDDWDSVMDSRISDGNEGSFSPGESALSFYTKFSDRSQMFYTWNKEMHYSIDAFTENNVGTMINYSNQIKAIQAKAPNINFGIAPLPQIPKSTKMVNFASYWALAVSNQVKDQKAIECFNFLKFLTGKDQAKKFAELTNTVSPRMDVAEKQKEDPWLGVFADQAISATSFKQFDNARIGFILTSAIDSIVDKGVSPADASQQASQLISQESRELANEIRGGWDVKF